MSNDAKTKEKVRIAVFFSLCILLVVGIFVSIGSGTVSLSVSETWAALLGEADADTDRIVNLIRLPRTIVTVLVGANLALAGCNLQGVLHNPLADPGIIGVSAGAGLFAMVIMLLFPEQSAMVPLAAFVGAVLSTGIVFFLAWEKGINPLRMILAGVAVATFYGGGMAALNCFTVTESRELWCGWQAAFRDAAGGMWRCFCLIARLALSERFCVRVP